MKKRPNNLLAMALLSSVVFLASCSDDDTPPPEENEEEEITTVTLTFTPDGGGTPVVATWFDVDGEDGPIAPEQTAINLAADAEYDLSITLTNTLADDPDEMDVTAEIRDEEPDEHMIFFGFTTDVFANPTGDGNIGPNSRNDDMRYDDTDGSNPIGLLTSWTTAATTTTGADFRVLLKHQPATVDGGVPEKSDTSTSDTGEDDFDITFVLNIQ